MMIGVYMVVNMVVVVFLVFNCLWGLFLFKKICNIMYKNGIVNDVINSGIVFVV